MTKIGKRFVNKASAWSIEIGPVSFVHLFCRFQSEFPNKSISFSPSSAFVREDVNFDIVDKDGDMDDTASWVFPEHVFYFW